jgi:hypothetical protein
MTKVNEHHQQILLHDLEKSAMVEDSIGLSSYPAYQHPGQEILFPCAKQKWQIILLAEEVCQ